MKENVGVSPLSVFILRLTLSGIFINAGLAHLFRSEQTVARLQQSPFSVWLESMLSLHTQVVTSGYALLLFGLLFLAGIAVRWSALALFLLLIPITVFIQMQGGLLHGPLWKNVALAGGLLFFMLNAPTVYSLLPAQTKKHE